MHMIDRGPVPEFSEDHRSKYRAEITLNAAMAYDSAQRRWAENPSHINRLKLDIAHAQVLTAALPPSPERDEWKDRAEGSWAALDLAYRQREEGHWG